MGEDDWPWPPLKETGTLEEHSSPTKVKTPRLKFTTVTTIMNNWDMTQWYICSQQYSGIPGSVYVLNGQDGGVLRGWQRVPGRGHGQTDSWVSDDEFILRQALRELMEKLPDLHKWLITPVNKEEWQKLHKALMETLWGFGFLVKCAPRWPCWAIQSVSR